MPSNIVITMPYRSQVLLADGCPESLTVIVTRRTRAAGRRVFGKVGGASGKSGQA